MGATEDDVSLSLTLLDNATDALHTCIVDDVHVGGRFAELLGTLTRRVRSCIVRIAAHGSIAASRATTPGPTKELAQRQQDPHQAVAGLNSVVSSSDTPMPRGYTSAPPLREQNQWTSINGHHPDRLNRNHSFHANANGLTYPPQSQGQIYNDPSLPGVLYDKYNPAVTIMPPPCYTYSNGVGIYDPHASAKDNDNINSNGLQTKQLYTNTGPIIPVQRHLCRQYLHTRIQYWLGLACATTGSTTQLVLRLRCHSCWLRARCRRLRHA